MRLAIMAFGGLAMAAPSFAVAAVAGPAPDHATVGLSAPSLIPDIVAVPEPATWVLLVGGSLGVGYLAQRRRKPSDPKN
jgi:hypothetical protein